MLDQSGFYERLGDHGRRSTFLSDLPIYLAIDPFAGLRGAGHAARSAQLSHRIGKIMLALPCIALKSLGHIKFFWHGLSFIILVKKSFRQFYILMGCFRKRHLR